jgi:Bor protein
VQRARTWYAVILVCVILTTSCYHYRAQAPTVPPKTEPEREVVWSFVWGLAQEMPTIDNCQGQALAEVHMSTNFAFALLTVVSIGFVSPQIVEWRCAGAEPTPGQIDIPSTTPRR